jgi:hypothetical protein
MTGSTPSEQESETTVKKIKTGPGHIRVKSAINKGVHR